MSAIDAKTILDSVNTVSDQVVGLQGRVEDLAGEVKDAARHGGADALRDVMQDRAAVEAFWSAAFGALASYGQQQTGRIVLGGIKGLMSRGLLFVVLGLLVYSVGGWAALAAVWKAIWGGGQ